MFYILFPLFPFWTTPSKFGVGIHLIVLRLKPLCGEDNLHCEGLNHLQMQENTHTHTLTGTKPCSIKDTVLPE